MKLVASILMSMLKVITPNKWWNGIKERIARTKQALTSTQVMRVTWQVVFLPIDIAVGIVKTFLIWVLPRATYYNLIYIVKRLFIPDILSNGKSLKVALKRVLLCIELFTKGAEKKASYGKENPDKTFYVIRPYYYMERNELATTLSNLLMHYYRNLQKLSYAVNKGWIPVVDWENYGPFRHAESYPINGTTNCWEYFWEQPSKYTLEEVYKSKNVILSDRNSLDYGYIPSPFFYPPLKKYSLDLANKCPKYAELFKFNTITQNYIDDWEKRLFPEDREILGVTVRGAAYGTHALKNHPKQPSVDELVDKVKNVLVLKIVHAVARRMRNAIAQKIVIV